MKTQIVASIATLPFALAGVFFAPQSAEAASFGTSWDGADYSLQNLLDGITTDGPGVDTVNDQTGYEWFTSTATGNSTASFMFEIAGYAPDNIFGIYNAAGTKIELFGGANDEGDSSYFTFLADGSVSVSTIPFAPGASVPTTSPSYNFYTDFGNEFGFYLTNGAGQTFYTQNSRNNGGYQQAVVYQGDDATTMALPGKAPGLFTDNEFIIAFEDLWVGGHTDRDYNDLVVMVESVEPVGVPEPTTLFGLGAVAVGLVASRRNKKNS